MRYPKQIYVYVCDYVDKEPIFSVAQALCDIPEDMDGESVASYSLGFVSKLSVKKTILSSKK